MSMLYALCLIYLFNEKGPYVREVSTKLDNCSLTRVAMILTRHILTT